MHYCLAVSVKVCLGFLTGPHEQGSCKGTVNVGALAFYTLFQYTFAHCYPLWI